MTVVMTEWNNTFGEQATTALAVITAATGLTVLSIFWFTRKSQKKLLEDPEVKYEVFLQEKEVRRVTGLLLTQRDRYS